MGVTPVAPVELRGITVDALQRRGRQARHSHRRAAYMLIAPFMLAFALLFLGPLLYALYLSLFKDRLFGGNTFVGLSNYWQVIKDSEFRAGVFRVLRFFVFQVPVMLVLAVVFALVLDSGRLRAPRLFRLAFFIPYAMPSVVAAIMWGSLYSPQLGVVPKLLSDIGLSGSWFLSKSGILTSVANVVTWEFAGYNMIIFYAALRAIPQELYEAAAVDGASPVRIAIHIKLPHLRRALLLTVVFSIIGAFQLFNEPYVLEKIAGSAVISSYWTPNYYAYTLAFSDNQINYAAAMSFLLGFVIFAVTVIGMGVMKYARRART